MEIHTIILWILSVLEIVLFVYIYSRYQRTGSIYSLCGLLLGFSLMSFFVGTLMTLNSNDIRSIVARAAFFSGGVSFVSLYAFSIYYPIRVFSKQNFVRLSIWIPVVILLPFTMFMPGFVNEIIVENGNIDIVPGSFFWIFMVFTVVYCLSAIVMLVSKIQRISGEQKKQLLIVIMIIGLSGILAVVTNQLLPVFGIPFNKVYGPESAGVVSIVIALIAMKK
ncbi:hypothetical protein KJ810_03340 [Patescibacteria group bacterium]|nr:hypothetical protein [Patescibacteria group bacterium]